MTFLLKKKIKIKKTAKLGRGNMYLTENRLSRNDMWCAEDNHNYVSYICADDFLDSNLN